MKDNGKFNIIWLFSYFILAKAPKDRLRSLNLRFIVLAYVHILKL